MLFTAYTNNLAYRSRYISAPVGMTFAVPSERCCCYVYTVGFQDPVSFRTGNLTGTCILEDPDDPFVRVPPPLTNPCKEQTRKRYIFYYSFRRALLEQSFTVLNSDISFVFYWYFFFPPFLFRFRLLYRCLSSFTLSLCRRLLYFLLLFIIIFTLLLFHFAVLIVIYFSFVFICLLLFLKIEWCNNE